MKEARVNARERFEIGNRNALIDLMRCGVEQAEFGHGAEIFDETCVRGSARGGKEGLAVRFGLDGRAQPLYEVSRHGYEAIGNRLIVERVIDTRTLQRRAHLGF